MTYKEFAEWLDSVLNESMNLPIGETQLNVIKQNLKQTLQNGLQNPTTATWIAYDIPYVDTTTNRYDTLIRRDVLGD